MHVPLTYDKHMMYISYTYIRYTQNIHILYIGYTYYIHRIYLRYTHDKHIGDDMYIRRNTMYDVCLILLYYMMIGRYLLFIICLRHTHIYIYTYWNHIHDVYYAYVV